MELKVYEIDGDYWVADTIENLKKEYEYLMGEPFLLENIDECDLEKDGMYWDFSSFPELNDIMQLIFRTFSNGESSFTLPINGHEYSFARLEEHAIYLPFKRVLEIMKPFEKPFIVSSMNY